MKNRYLFGLLVTIFAVGMTFSGCDLFTPSGGSTQGTETYGDLIIEGEDSERNPVVIRFSTTRLVKKVTMTSLEDGDSYEIHHKNVKVSFGDISVSGSTPKTVQFNPKNGDSPFTGTYNSGKDLSFTNNQINTSPPIKGFQVKTENNPDNSTTQKVVEQFGSDVASVDGSGNVVIDFRNSLRVKENITLPAGVKLIFNTRDDDSFIINGNVKVTAKGGIEVPSGRGLTVISDGSLVVEGSSSIIRGKLNIGEGTTLDISGSVTIESGGLLSLAGEANVGNVSNLKYPKSSGSNPPKWPVSGADAVFKLSGSLVTKKDGRFQIPDPTCFDVKNITGVMKVESGGELILVTADKNGEKDLHPLIGTLSTATEGVPVGADYVMDPALNPESRIEARINSGIPVFELTGRAVALGRLIFDPPRPSRLQVYVVYPFTVAKDSVLQVGNSTDLFTSLLISGPDFFMGGINKGVLTNSNSGKILIFENSGIVEWYGGYFDHKNRVFLYRNSDIASTTPADTGSAKGKLDNNGKETRVKWWKNGVWNVPWLTQLWN